MNELLCVLGLATALLIGLLSLLNNVHAIIYRCLCRLLQSSEFFLKRLEVLVIRVRLVVLHLAALEQVEVKLVYSLHLFECHLLLLLALGQLLLQIVDLKLLLVNYEVSLRLFTGKVKQKCQRELGLAVLGDGNGWLWSRTVVLLLHF